MGKPAYIGDVKAGCALKLIQNLMGMSINAVCSESIKLAKLANIPKEQFIEQISNSGAFSFQFKNTASGIAVVECENSLLLSIRCSP